MSSNAFRRSRAGRRAAVMAVAAAGVLGLATPLIAQAPPSSGTPAAPSAVGTPAASGATTPPATISFDDALRIALSQSTVIQQARNAEASDATAVQQQKLQFLPDLRVSVSSAQDVGRNFNQSQGAIVDQTSQSMSGGVSSSVTLFNGLKNVASLQQAQLSQQASGQDVTRARQTVAYTVASNYLTLVTAQEQLGVQQQNLAAQQAEESQIDKFVKAEERPISDLYQQQAAVASAQAAVVSAERAVELAKVDLIQTLQLDPAGQYDFVAPAVNDSAAVGTHFDLDSLMTDAYAHRVDLHAQATRVSAAGAGVKAADASKWPTVSLSAGYNTGFTTAADASVADQLDQRRGGSVGIGVSIPIFDNGSTEAAAERAQLAKNDAQLSLENAKQAVALDVRRAYLDFESAQQQLAAAEAQQKAAALAVTTAQQRYQLGAGTLLDVTQAQASEVQAASALVNARYTLVFQQATMSYSTGTMDPTRLTLGE